MSSRGMKQDSGTKYGENPEESDHEGGCQSLRQKLKN